MTPVMADDKSRTVAHMFNILDAWRHLPGYRLEGRVAPFFELFLHDVLGESLGVELHPVIIPEFPLRKGTLNNNNSNQSYNVDYVAFSDDCKKAFLVELKTDMSSRRPEQDKYLLDARKKPFRCFVSGAMMLARASKNKPKYVHLMHLLSNLELVSIENAANLHHLTFCKPRRGWNKAFCGVQLVESWKSTETKSKVIYIQPRECTRKDQEPENNIKYVYFKDVANIVQKYGDLGCLFANYLRQWTEDPASQPPEGAAHRS